MIKPLGLTTYFLRTNLFKTDISLKFIKTNGEAYGQRMYSRKFDNHRLFRVLKLISLKDLMDPSNSLCNEQTNSVTVEAKIKIID